jgi:hypothetical protein
MADLGLSAVLRREEKKKKQRQAALSTLSGKFFDFDFVPDVLPCRSPPLRSAKRITSMKHPVSPPSTFLLDCFKAEEWLLVERRKNRRRCNLKSRRRRLCSPSASMSPPGPNRMYFQTHDPAVRTGRMGLVHSFADRRDSAKGSMGLEPALVPRAFDARSMIDL